MTRDDIIRMAREAGAKDYGTGEEGATALMLRDDAIERFFHLAAAHEREECAKLCEDEIERIRPLYSVTAENCTKVIRARGEK
jgi:hypothetical protein